MFLLFLNGGTYLSMSKGSTTDMRSQRKQKEMGLDSEKTKL